MARRLLIPITLACVLLPAVAAGEVQQREGLRVAFDGSFAPRSLPRDRGAPLRVWISGRVATSDGSQPPPLRRLELELNRHGRLSVRGLPTCRAAALQSTSTTEALERCRGALVGKGSFHASYDFGPDATIPSSGSILAFNGRRASGPALLLHLYGTVPVQATFVLPLAIHREDRGEFGTVLRARIPKLAGGLGSVTQIALEIGREYSVRGERRSYLAASCGAPLGLDAAVFPFLRGTFAFAGRPAFRTTLLRACRVR